MITLSSLRAARLEWAAAQALALGWRFVPWRKVNGKPVWRFAGSKP